MTGNHVAPVGLIAFPREQERPGTSPGALIEFHPKGRKHQPQQQQQEQQPQQACGLRTEPSAICREVRRVYKVSPRTCLCKLLQQNAANLKTDMIVFGQIKEGRRLSMIPDVSTLLRQTLKGKLMLIVICDTRETATL